MTRDRVICITTNVAVILLMVGMTLQLEELIQENTDLHNLVEEQGNKLKKCTEEYLQLEEKNMVCRNTYKSKVGDNR